MGRRATRVQKEGSPQSHVNPHPRTHTHVKVTPGVDSTQEGTPPPEDTNPHHLRLSTSKQKKETIQIKETPCM